MSMLGGQGNRAAASEVYGSALVAAATEKQYVFLAMKYAHFLVAGWGDVPAAREVYEAALAKYPANRTLWEGAIHLEQTSSAPDR